jgi:hypothetical protein
MMSHGNGTWELLEQPWYNTPVADPYGHRTEMRLGWWGIATDGDLTKVGEYQDLTHWLFSDVDHLASDGLRTVDLFATLTDRKGGQAGLYFFGPSLTVDVDYQRYDRRLDHDPLSNFSDPGSGDPVVVDDLNAGEDYAIRVQQLDTHVKGKLTKNIKYRVNLWLQRKNGDRQAIGSQHCAGGIHFGNNANATCHVLSQTQRIDWLTMKVEPVIEGRWGPVTAEYSRPMRSFGQNDQIVTREYGDFLIYGFSGDQPYAHVPESFKQTDRLRLGVEMTHDTRFYGTMHAGNTHNRFRQTDRRFYGADLRLTNRRWDDLTLTAFARMNRQLNEFPPFFVDPEGQAMSPTYVSVFTSTVQPQPSAVDPRYGMRQPIDYLRYATGIEATCRPRMWMEFAEGLSIRAGCEYGAIHREFAEYAIEQSSVVASQRHTGYVSYSAGLNRRWSPKFQTFLRYKGRITSEPLYGVDLLTGETNTNLPENEDLVEIGGTWAPAPHFIANVSAGIQHRSHNSDIAEFTEDDYPVTLTLFYAPESRLSLYGGYGRYSNWIDQDILFPGDNPGVDRLDRQAWNYGGLSQVLSIGAGYAWTPHVSLNGGIQYVWARNAIDSLQPWPDVADYFDVIVNRARCNAGVDWWLGDGITAYVRYVFEDYEDASVDYNSGTAHMFLTGASAVY